jgi:hypothetical protein
MFYDIDVCSDRMWCYLYYKNKRISIINKVTCEVSNSINNVYYDSEKISIDYKINSHVVNIEIDLLTDEIIGFKLF